MENNYVYVGMAADIIHEGHINILEKASKYGKVIVGLLSDDAIKSYKRQPIISYNNRKRVIKSIKYVDKVVEQNTHSYVNNLNKIQPKYVVHGDDWNSGVQSSVREDVINTLIKWDGKLIEIPYTHGISTTDIINKIKFQ